MFIFFSNPVPFNKQNYQKQKGPGTSDQLLFRLQNKFRKNPLLVMYYPSLAFQVSRTNLGKIGNQIVREAKLQLLCKIIGQKLSALSHYALIFLSKNARP